MNPDRAIRVKVACINWSSPYVVPRACVATVNAKGEYLQTRYFVHWVEADRLAKFIRTSHQLTQEADHD